jgi:hypothetical protein
MALVRPLDVVSQGSSPNYLTLRSWRGDYFHVPQVQATIGQFSILFQAFKCRCFPAFLEGRHVVVLQRQARGGAHREPKLRAPSGYDADRLRSSGLGVVFATLDCAAWESASWKVLTWSLVRGGQAVNIMKRGIALEESIYCAR